MRVYIISLLNIKIIYLSQYFNVALTVAEVKSLLGFRLPVLESKSLEAIQHDRKPSVFTINAMDAPTSPADFIHNYVETRNGLLLCGMSGVLSNSAPSFK